MKKAHLIHNPSAGNEAHGKKSLLSALREQGVDCRYSSTKKKGWKVACSSPRLVIAAGGDGTIRKVVKEQLKTIRLEDISPIAVVPLGTANNLASTLGIPVNEAVVPAIGALREVTFDVCKVKGADGIDFFIESFGYGVFPALMHDMAIAEKEDGPEQEELTALTRLQKIVASYKPEPYEIKLDGVDHSGDYLMVEVLNIKSFGPQLQLAPGADVSDGMTDVVLVSEKDRQQLLQVIEAKIDGKEIAFDVKPVRCREIIIRAPKGYVHADDQLQISRKKTKVGISVLPSVIRFMVPDAKKATA